jgi:hypothetical protein
VVGMFCWEPLWVNEYLRLIVISHVRTGERCAATWLASLPYEVKQLVGETAKAFLTGDRHDDFIWSHR